MNERTRDNAMRLAFALAQRAEDPRCVEQLAKLLNYVPEQLAQDMRDLWINLNDTKAEED